jgi:hypothetical protein
LERWNRWRSIERILAQTLHGETADKFADSIELDGEFVNIGDRLVVRRAT